MGCVLLIFLGMALFATLSVVVRRSETAAIPSPMRLPDSCLYGAVNDMNNTAQYDGVFFDEDTYVDSSPPSPPSERSVDDTDDIESGRRMNKEKRCLNWSPISTPNQALASSIQERLAILQTELVS